MKKTLTIIGFLAVFTAGAALADDDCFVPMADWQPRDAVAMLAEENGWTVRRIKIDDGCYEIDGRDAEGLPEDHLDAKAGGRGTRCILTAC